jgi:hypothetical protein
MSVPSFTHPLCVYVLFHKDSENAAILADYVFRWLRLHDDTGVSGDNTGMGVPVYYRSVVEAPKKEADKVEGRPAEAKVTTGEDKRAASTSKVVPNINWSDSAYNVIVVLSDDKMNVDPHWQQALLALNEECLEKKPRKGGQRKPLADRLIVPVMLNLSLNALAFLGANRDPLRVYDPKDPTVDLTASWGPRLRRGLTELLVRELYKTTAGAPPRLKTFISHAKDGALDQAQAIRDGLLSVSKLEPWFDSNDISAGHPWAAMMKDAAAHATGGLLAVVDPVWPTRPWCRHEAAVARTPRRIETKSVANRKKVVTTREPSPVWSVQPAVVARVAGARWYRLPASVAQLPTIDCTDPIPTRKWIAPLVDRLLLEHLLAEVAHRSAKQYANVKQNYHGIWWYLTFVPDNYTLERLSEHTRHTADDKRADRLAKPDVIIYPGHGLRPVERAELERTAKACISPNVSLAPLERLRFEHGRPTMEQFATLADAATRPAQERTLVGISAGGDSSDVRAAGFGEVHFNDLMLRLTRRLLSDGHRVAYGGTLSKTSNLTTALINAASGWRYDGAFDLDTSLKRQQQEIDQATQALTHPPVMNYAAWPNDDKLDDAQRGSTLGLVGYETFNPHGRYRGLQFDRLSQDDRKALHGRLAGDALTFMRTKLAADCKVRVFFAGKVHGWSGWLPGIAEELVLAAKANQRCVLIGAYGGLTQILVDFLLDSEAKWPEELGWDNVRAAWEKRTSENREKWLAGTYEGERKHRLEELRNDMLELHVRVHTPVSGSGCVNTIFSCELTHFATVSSATEVVNHVARVASDPNTDPKDWLT